jgi:hypothetical protein
MACCKLQFMNRRFVIAVYATCLVNLSACSNSSIQKSSQPAFASTKTEENALHSSVNSEQQDEECRGAARKALGSSVIVVKCGELNSPGVLEVLAALKADFSSRPTSIAIRKMVILRKNPSGWHTSLTVGREIRNEAGYVGIDYIDDYYHFHGYWLTLSEKPLGPKAGLSFSLLNTDSADGSSEQVSTEIAWNPNVGRYQEWTYFKDPAGFASEIKHPQHWKPGVKLH